MKTVITHFFNESYLLPWWLEHHKKMFDMGILIDYHSTDDSVEIIKSICPHWQIFTSGFSHFDAENCDYEVEFYERQITGYRIALTTTEFLVGNIDKLTLDTTARVQWYVPCIRFTDWDLERQLDRSMPLWTQLKNGLDYKKYPEANLCRSLHNFNDIKYKTGRHYTPYNTEDCIIFHYAHCIVGQPMLDRRLQIQHKISQRDKEKKLGSHHYVDNNGLNLANLKHMHDTWLNVGSEDLSYIVNKFL